MKILKQLFEYRLLRLIIERSNKITTDNVNTHETTTPCAVAYIVSFFFHLCVFIEVDLPMLRYNNNNNNTFN